MKRKRQVEIDRERGWKECRGCHHKKPLEDFYWHIVNQIYRVTCKKCRNNTLKHIYKQTHNTRKEIKYILYDVVTKETIELSSVGIYHESKKLGISHCSIWDLFHRNALHVAHRYISPNNKDKIFTLVDFETGQEYDCITNRTMLIHLGIKPQNNWKHIARGIWGMRNKEQKPQTAEPRYTSIYGRLFCLKGTTQLPAAVKLKNSYHISKLYKIREKRQLEEKIYKRLLSYIRIKIKKQKTIKNDHTMKLIGCSISFLLNYLTGKFKPGMTWQNYGKWEIDHIYPSIGFDLTIPEEQKRCFHYTNLQPLWAKDNRSKGDRLPDGTRARLTKNLKPLNTEPQPALNFAQTLDLSPSTHT